MSRRRRRKARSSQPSKSRFGKWLARGAVALLLLLVVGVFLGYRAVKKYLRSDDFRVMLEEEAGYALGGDALFQPFEWDGWSVTTDEFHFTGEEGVQELRVSDIGASIDIGAVWDGVYRIENVSLRKLELLGDFREGREAVDRIRPKRDKGFWGQFLPEKVEVTGVDVATVTGKALTDGGDWAFDGISAEVRPGSGQEIYDVVLRDGSIETPISLMKNLKLREARGRYSLDRFYLLSSDFEVLEQAHVSLTGEYDMVEKRWDVIGDVTGARCEEVVSEDWRQRLIGALDVSFKVRGRPEADAVTSGSLEIDQGILTALPILDRIAAYTNVVRFRRLALSEARLDFRQEGERLELNDIKIASEGLVRIEGRMVLVGDQIQTGNFRVGITPGTLAHLPGAETKVFQRGELGLLWSPIRISGNVNSPKEDLSDRLIAAAGERMFELIPETGTWALKYSGEKVGDATRAILAKNGVILGGANHVIEKGTDIVKDVTEGALEKGSKTATDVVDTLFDFLGRPIPKEK